MATAIEVITNGLTEIGALAPGESISQDLVGFCFGKLNRLISQWSTRKLYIFTVAINRYTLTPSQPSYTIGPSGADFTAPRPLGIGPGYGIKNANIVLTTVTPEVHIPLAIWDDDQWANIRVNQIPVTLPSAIYNDGAWPNSTLYLWGYPTQANDLELFTNQQLTEFPDLSTDVTFPPGYEEALTLSYAESVGVAFGREISPDLRSNANKARAAIQALNTAAPLLATADSGIPSQSPANVTSFNYRTGLFGTGR